MARRYVEDLMVWESPGETALDLLHNHLIWLDGSRHSDDLEPLLFLSILAGSRPDLPVSEVEKVTREDSPALMGGTRLLGIAARVHARVVTGGMSRGEVEDLVRTVMGRPWAIPGESPVNVLLSIQQRGELAAAAVRAWVEANEDEECGDWPWLWRIDGGMGDVSVVVIGEDLSSTPN